MNEYPCTSCPEWEECEGSKAPFCELVIEYTGETASSMNT